MTFRSSNFCFSVVPKYLAEEMNRRKAKQMYESSPTSLQFLHKLQKTNYILERRVSKSGVTVPKGPCRKRPRRWGGAGQHNADPGVRVLAPGKTLTSSRRLSHTHSRGQCGAVRQRPRALWTVRNSTHVSDAVELGTLRTRILFPHKHLLCG